MKKITKIEKFLRELRTVRIESFDKFKENIVVKRFIERNIEFSIEQIVDICKHFISTFDLKEPEIYSECFDILVKARVITGGTINTFKSIYYERVDA